MKKTCVKISKVGTGWKGSPEGGYGRGAKEARQQAGQAHEPPARQQAGQAQVPPAAHQVSSHNTCQHVVCV